MKTIQNIALTNFEFWSGGKENAEILTLSEIMDIEAILSDLYPDGLTNTEINDIVWFEHDTIAEWLGYDNWDELIENRT